MPIAITRPVSSAINRCELTHVARTPIDLNLARQQHQRYEEILSSLGCTLIRLPEEPGLPDSVFVEDTAIVVDEIAVICRPGAESRRAETDSVAAALHSYRPLAFIQAPGTLDGGDVLRLDRKLFVGLSERSNTNGIAQLHEYLLAFGYTVAAIPISGCLHLKSAVSQIGEQTLLLNPQWIDKKFFAAYKIIEIDPTEPLAANGLGLANQVIYPSSFPKTLQRIQQQGIMTIPVDLSELAKAEGAVTCCSIIITSP